MKSSVSKNIIPFASIQAIIKLGRNSFPHFTGLENLYILKYICFSLLFFIHILLYLLNFSPTVSFSLTTSVLILPPFQIHCLFFENYYFYTNINTHKHKYNIKTIYEKLKIWHNVWSDKTQESYMNMCYAIISSKIKHKMFE